MKNKNLEDFEFISLQIKCISFYYILKKQSEYCGECVGNVTYAGRAVCEPWLVWFNWLNTKRSPV